MQPTKIEGQVDPVLEHVARVVDRVNSGLSVVLHVDGCLVVGTLISSQEFINLHADVIEKMFPPSDAKAKEMRQMARDNSIEQAKAQLATFQPLFLNLKEVTIIHGNQKSTTPMWRTKLDAVSGWYFGAFNKEEEAPDY